MTNRKIKRFVKERDEMLLKCSVKELRKFVYEHEELYDPAYIRALHRMSDEFLELVLHKMIVNCTNLPFDFRQKSADWLLERGFALEMGGASND